MENENTVVGKVVALPIEEEMRNCYLDYAMSVIVGRALPDVRDGLKPVHRRALYSMFMLNNYHNKPFLKSARVVGDVIGKYHPHGDSAVYNTIVRMAQEFSLRYPMVDGQGNFGSIDGDSPAAMRYTEIRMQKISEDMLRDIDKDTVDWKPNYDESLKEPIVLPARIPNLLVNGSEGIAVGMATKIPPHNLTEIMQALQALIKDSSIDVSELMTYVKGPDFPTHGTIQGTEGIKAAYHTGRGIVQIRAVTEIEDFGKYGRQRIIVSEIPYQVNKARLIEKIAELVNSKQISGISDIRDETNREGIRVVVELKKGENANVILNRLYKHTQMQISFGIIFLSLHNGQPKVMNLKEQLQYFIDHRREVVVRRTNFELNKAKQKAHVLEGLKLAVENMDDIIHLIKNSEGPTDARLKLITSFELSEIQAQAILDLRLQRLTGLERDKIIKDYEEILKVIHKLESILNSEELINTVISTEFTEIAEKYGDERRTKIVAKADEIQMEDLIKKEDVIVTITHKGYIKRMANDTYKVQHRGGTGVKGANLKDDFFTKIFTTNTLTTLLIFTSRGFVFSLKVYNLPDGSRTFKGRNIVNLIPLQAGDSVKDIISMPQEIIGKYLLFSTKKGLIKRTPLEDYKNVKQTALKAIKIQDGDSLLRVNISDGSRDILLCATSGKIIRFKESDCRPSGRVSQGVKGIAINSDDEVIGMEIIDDGVEILSVTEHGFGKRTPVSEYRVQSRGGKGIIAMKLTSRNGRIMQIKPVNEKEGLMIITNNGQVIKIRISGISLIGRNTQGVKLINLKTDESVVAVESMVDLEKDIEPIQE